MIIKERPEDFVVRERYDLDGVGDEGEIAVYVVEKRDRTTFDAAIALAKAAGVPTDQVRFAGIKDRRAVTTQVMSVEGGAPASIEQNDLKVRLLGRASEHVDSERIVANEFDLWLRDLAPADLERLDRGFTEIGGSGIPNYFDDQRFGAARSGRGFPVRELLRGDAEEALRLMVAAPSDFDAEAHAERKRKLSEHWGDWPRCASLAYGHHELEVFRHLAERPGDFLGAMRRWPRRERLMQLFAYQSKIWNAALDRLVRRRLPEDRVRMIASELGALAAWGALTPDELARFESTRLPLPDASTKSDDPDVTSALDAALAEDGLRVADLEVRGVRGLEFREEERACVLFPDALEAEDPIADPHHRGRFALRVRLSLPRGTYATLVLKRADA